MDCIVLASGEAVARQWQYRIENLGEDWRCIPVLQPDQALLCLQDWADVLLLLPCRESRLLLRTLSGGPLLAPPWILGAGLEAPDGQLAAPEELPALLAARRWQGLLPALSARHLSLTAEIAAALFRAMGMPPKLRAWDFLPEMAALTVVHPPLLQNLQHGLYPLIGGRHQLSAAGVERSLRLCVESTWSHGSLAALDRFFGSSVDPEKGKPTNREFLCRVQERLTLTMQRLV